MTGNLSAATARRAHAQPTVVRTYLERHRKALREMLQRPGEGGIQLARRHADTMDDVLRTLYEAARVSRSERKLLLGAVGGYGRHLLGWKSDVDVCFLTDEPPEQIASIVDEVLYPLWDAGVSVGHQIVTLSEVVTCAADDLPTATELLDLRPLAGDATLLQSLHDRLYASLFAERKVASFIDQLQAHTQARHKRFGDSVYLLEPDVKNGTGGLRDLDFALWAARARFRVGSLPELCARGVLPANRVGEVQRALDFVWTVRNQLHELAGRRADRLTFGEQEKVARALGYHERITLEPGASELHVNGAMVEAFMSDYYRHARLITQVSDQVIGHAQRRTGRKAEAQRVGEGLVTCEGGLALEHPGALRVEPALALRLYVAAVARNQPVLGRSRDAISTACADAGFCAAIRASREASALFVQLVASQRKPPLRAGSIVSELHDVGILLAMIPEFAPVVGRVHHDIYHVYTVDVHSVAAVDRLHQLARGELAGEHPLGCRLAAEITRPRMLALATLLHDVGKAIGGHNHAQRGAEMAAPILARLGLPPEDVDDACHLILKHLALYVVAARRDLGDPATIADFAQEVRGREGLRDLYLLTVADLSTTSPSAMTKWKAGMVDALWRATDAQLSGQGGAESARAARVRTEVRTLWSRPRALTELDEYLDTMPERYLLTNTPSDIVAHAMVATEPRGTPVAATLAPSSLEDVMELCVVTEGRARTGLCVVAGDRPGLLAAISAAISANRLRIQAAQIHSRLLRGGGVQAVDLFWVHVPSEDELELDARIAKLSADLNALITGERQPHELVRPRRSSRWSARPMPPVETEVVIEHHASSQHTIIEVLTQDQPALLYHLAEALHTLGLTISIAKISTEGTRVIDVFYVTEADGTKVEPGARTEQVRQLLHATLRLQYADA